MATLPTYDTPHAFSRCSFSDRQAERAHRIIGCRSFGVIHSRLKREANEVSGVSNRARTGAAASAASQFSIVLTRPTDRRR